MNDENPYQSPGTYGDWRDVEPVGNDAEPDSFDESFALFTSCGSLSEANLFQALLKQHGIESYLENAHAFGGAYYTAVGGVKVYILASDMEEAVTLFRNGLPKADNEAPLGDITFECEECGKEITFPGSRRGKTEVCPKCHEYVDVPD